MDISSASVDIHAATISLLLVMMMNVITKRTNNRRLARVVFGIYDAFNSSRFDALALVLITRPVNK